jgi:hypothetical protein
VLILIAIEYIKIKRNIIAKIINYEKLSKRFKDKWVKALRSGDYKQTQSTLYDGKDGYCCLGVGAIVCGVPKHKLLNIGLLNNKYNSDLVKEYKIPKQIVGESDPYDEDYNIIVDKLSTFNDTDEGKSFKWIASYIERYL